MPENGYTLKEMIEHIFDDVKEIRRQLEKQNGRIGKLERWRAYMIGIMAVIAFIVSEVLHLIGR